MAKPGATLLRHKCPCCGLILDPRGYHLIFCNHTAGNLLRHNLLKELLHKIIRSCGGESAKMEPKGQFENDARRLDIDMRNYTAGATAHYGLDLTVVSPTKGLGTRRSDGSWTGGKGARQAGYAAAQAERMKGAKYGGEDGLDMQAGQTLKACAVEAFGRLGDTFVGLLRELADMAHTIRRWPRWFFWHKWAPKIAACLAEGTHAKVACVRSEYARVSTTTIQASAGDTDPWDQDVDATGPVDGARRGSTRRMPLQSQRPWLRRRRQHGAVRKRFQQAARRTITAIANGDSGAVGDDAHFRRLRHGPRYDHHRQRRQQRRQHMAQRRDRPPSAGGYHRRG